MAPPDLPDPLATGGNPASQTHVYPLWGREHQMAPTCWCCPRLDYKDPATGNEVWIHHLEN